MPNPRSHNSYVDQPLDQALGFSSHVIIRCAPPASMRGCGRVVIWTVASLYEKLPNCRTYREFTSKLYCDKCKLKGWVALRPAQR